MGQCKRCGKQKRMLSDGLCMSCFRANYMENRANQVNPVNAAAQDNGEIQENQTNHGNGAKVKSPKKPLNIKKLAFELAVVAAVVVFSLIYSRMTAKNLSGTFEVTGYVQESQQLVVYTLGAKSLRLSDSQKKLIGKEVLLSHQEEYPDAKQLTAVVASDKDQEKILYAWTYDAEEKAVTPLDDAAAKAAVGAGAKG